MSADLLRLPGPIVERVLIWGAETTALAAVLCLVASIGDRWRRPLLGPAARHALWLLVLLKLMMPPVVSWPWSRPWATEAAATVAATPKPILQLTLVEEMQPVEEIAIDDEASPSIVVPEAPREPLAEPVRVSAEDVSQLAIVSWLVGSLVVAARQFGRIGRFRRLTREVGEVPDWLIEEAAIIASSMAVRLPNIRVVTGLQSPLLWCLGRPVLLVPEGLLKSLETGRWRCILAHEFAHLRRGDSWVSRLQLVAGVVWWWNPLYWWACSRMNAEAELSCDAWVIATLPKDRLTYAESLVRICAALTPARVPAPSLGVAGSGRFFERRLTMILRERVSNRLSLQAVLTALLLLLLAAPSWTMAKSVATSPKTDPASISTTVVNSATVSDDDEDDADDEDADDEDDEDADDDDEMTAKKKAKDEKKVDEKKADEKKGKKAEKKEKKEKSEKKTKIKVTDKEMDEAAIEKVVKDALGPDFEKKMKALGEEMEKKFGPGSDFEKQMQSLGKEMETKFGPEFQKKMAELQEKISKEVEGKFGQGSQLIEKKLDEAKTQKDRAEKAEMKAKIKVDKALAKTSKKPKAKAGSRDAKVKELEAQIRKLSDELKKLKSEEGDKEGEEEDD